MRLPGWISINAVNRIHSSLEVVGLFSFALAVAFEWSHMPKSSDAGFSVLVICEAFAFVYGRREKALSDQEAEALRRSIEDRDKKVSELSAKNAALEQRMKSRTIPAQLYEELKTLLTQYGGSRVDVVVFDHHIPETQVFAQQVVSLFIAANWKCELWEARAAKYRLPGKTM